MKARKQKIKIIYEEIHVVEYTYEKPIYDDYRVEKRLMIKDFGLQTND